MRISSKSRYAITTMLELVVNKTGNAVKLADISEKQGISLSYLEQLFAALRGNGLVKGRRGPGGGYMLGRSAAEISVVDIICAVDEWVEYSHQKLTNPTSTLSLQTSTRSLWDDLSLQIYDFLASISLQDLVDGKRSIASVTQLEPAAEQVPTYTDKAA